MNGKRIIVSILCVILLLTSLVAPTIFVAGASTCGYDYSRPGSYFNTEFTSADLLEYIGIELSDGERAYLEEYGAFRISYENVTTQQITVVFHDGIAEIIARPYSYISAGSESVTWLPMSVSIDGNQLDMTEENGVYVARIDASLVNENSTVDVSYKLDGADVYVSASEINAVLNLAYLDAPDIKERVEAARVEYSARKNAYDAYYALNKQAVDKYYFDKDAHRIYLGEKLVYDEKNAAYLEYCKELDKYNSALSVYNEYVQRLEEYNTIVDNNLNYDENLKKYQAEKEKYDEYLPKITVVREQIKVLDDGLFLKTTYLERQLYSSLFSSLIDTVISIKDVYINLLGIDEKVVDGCLEASNTIKDILAPEGGVAYKDLVTEEEKYEFYYSYQEDFCKAIIQLTQSLCELYSNEQLRLMMHAAPKIPGINKPDYTEKLSIFISQLILFANALSDEPVMSYDGTVVLDENTQFNYWNEAGEKIENRSAFDILELAQNEYVTDSGNAEPIPGGYPTEVIEPIEPVFVEKVPDKPTEVSRPIAPEEVENPGDAPIPVSEPVIPEGFIEEPIRPDMIDDPIYALLISDLDSGKLALRPEVTDGVSYTPTVTLTKRLYSTDAVTVTFTDGKGGVLSEISVDRGTSANFMGELPTKAEDISATYTFGAWVDADGNAFDLSAVSADVTLYPYFTPNYKPYDINYDVNGKGKNEINVSVPDVELEYLPIDHFITLAEENFSGLSVSAKNVALNLSYGSLIQLKTSGVSSIDVRLDTSVQGDYTLEIILMDDSGESVDVSASLEVSIPCTDNTFANKSSLYYYDGSEKVYVNKSYSSGGIKYKSSTNRLYHLTITYPIKVSSSVSDMVSAPENSVPGQTVSLSLNVPEGFAIDLYYVLESDSAKTKHAIEGSTFVMPSDIITILGTTRKIESPLYTVIFINDGKEISSKQYKYGDTVRIPNSPIKLSDGEYRYKFIGWSPEVTTVTGDVTYVAQYEITPVIAREDGFPWFVVLLYSFIAITALGVFLIVILVLHKVGVIDVKKIIGSVRRKLARLGAKEQSENGSPASLGSDSVEKEKNTEQESDDHAVDDSDENADSAAKYGVNAEK